jgi:hypothetical protein
MAQEQSQARIFDPILMPSLMLIERCELYA